MNNTIIVLTGPSGSGKTAVAKYLVSRYDMELPMRVTTRQRRNENENYVFASMEEFDMMSTNNQFFFETGSKDKRYGFVHDGSDRPIVIDTSYKNAIRLYNEQPNVIIVQFAYANIEETMKERFNYRQDSHDTLNERIEYAIKDYYEYYAEVQEIAALTLYSDMYTIDEVKEIVSYVLEDKVLNGVKK